MDKTTLKSDLDSLKRRVVEARERVEIARHAYDQANRDMARYMNELNEAEKAFDAATTAFRQSGPNGSDWKNESPRAAR